MEETSTSVEETATKAGATKENKKQSSLINNLKSIYKHYSGTICILVPYLMLGVYPSIVNIVNPAPPINQLEWISGKIVLAQRDHPNIRIEMADGSKRDFDFYANLTGIVRGLPRFGGASNQELANLKGCQAEIGVVPIKWLIFPHNNRIWELRSNCFKLSYEQLKKTFQMDLTDGLWIDVVLHGFFIVFILYIFCLERRKRWAQQRR